jgi:tetratricopeptide (TPR) repeat protein
MSASTFVASTVRSLLRALPRSASVAGLLVALAIPSVARQDADLKALWNDPTFKKQFVAGYGVNADIEPRVSPEEVKILEKIQPLMADDLPKARATLVKQMKTDCSAILDFTLAGILFQQDEMKEALRHYDVAVAKFPSFRRAWRNIGLIHAREGEYDGAITAFTRMIELGGGDGYSFGLLGFAYAAKQDFQAAEAAYRSALLLQPENTEWRLGLTRCVFKQGKFQDASALLDVLIERYPDKADFWLLQAHTYLGMKQPLAAAQNLEAVDVLGGSTSDSLHTLGDIYVSEKLLPLAVHAYHRALDIDLQQPLTRQLRSAEVLAAQGAHAEARKVVEHIRGMRGASLEASDRAKLLKLDARLSMADGSGGEDTAKVLEEIVALDPLDGEALLLLGQHHARQGDGERAIFFYERAASIEAFEANAKVRIAQTLVGSGRYADALPLLRRAQELKPREDIARYLEQVERLARSRR